METPPGDATKTQCKGEAGSQDLARSAEKAGKKERLLYRFPPLLAQILKGALAEEV